MINRTAILDELAKLPASGVSRTTPATVSIKGSHGSFHATAIAVEQLAGIFSELDYRMQPGQTLATDRLPGVGAALAERLQYLMEPIAPVEFDGNAAVLQMRSVPPTEEDPGTRSYFEVLVRPHEISVRRYAVRSGKAQHRHRDEFDQGDLCAVWERIWPPHIRQLSHRQAEWW